MSVMSLLPSLPQRLDPVPALRVVRLWGRAAETMAYGGLTIQARSGMIAHALITEGRLPGEETIRMVGEKPLAAAQSAFAFWRTAFRMWPDPQAILHAAEAGLRPLRSRTRRNASRLNRKPDANSPELSQT